MAGIDWEARISEAIDAFNRGDYETALTHASDDVELRRIDTSPDSRDIVRGRERVVEFFRPDVFVDQRGELVEFVPAGEGTTITRIRFSARGAGSGLELPPLDSFVVWRIDGDAIARIEFYTELEAARRAAGLDPA
jgi:ketosteroid isomerase-like protein